MKININNVSKSFGENRVLNGISLEATSGKALGILGRNGAGKTTMIRIIMGVFNPDEGQLTIDGKAIDRDKISTGYLPEERGLYPKKTIIDQMVYFGRLKGMDKKSATTSALYWLDRLGMMDHKTKRLDTLSKGNQQKIQLAITLLGDPDIVILDEPFSGLDPVNAMLLKDVVKELLVNNKIVLFSSHQMNYIEEFCDNIAILNGGNIVLSGSIQEIKRGYDRSKIIVVSKEIPQIKENLEKNPIARETTISGQNLVVTLKSPNDKTELFAILSRMNLDIDEIKVYEPTLNDIFVEYTEDNLS